jgi:hypothetical protein
MRILPPFLLLSHTVPTPPTCITPNTMITMLETTITAPCKKSVHTTAFIPPWKQKVIILSKYSGVEWASYDKIYVTESLRE